MSQEYNPGKIKPIIKIIARIVGQDPDSLLARVEAEVPELKDKTRCANCDASMSQYAYNLNVIDTALIIAMAKHVRQATKGGVSFTDANRVHVPTLPVSDAVRHRTSRCAKLGLIAKYLKDGRQVKGLWVITRRGFAALKGEEIPDGIIVWRGQTIERPDSMTTFAKVATNYKTKVDNHIKKHNTPPEDSYRDEVMGYNQNEWVDFAGLHEGRLF